MIAEHTEELDVCHLFDRSGIKRTFLYFSGRFVLNRVSGNSCSLGCNKTNDHHGL